MAEKKLSPMMAQYLETKKSYPDTVLFYRIGDFYEMFYEDAKKVSDALDLVLTGKDCGTGEKAPMCGVPYHAVDSYLARLLSKGFKVAVAEQMEDPKQAKGIVRREVVRIVTPGTVTMDAALEESRNNFLMSIYYDGKAFGVSSVDISTGEFLTTCCHSQKELLDEISHFSPSEIVHNARFLLSGADIDFLKNRLEILLTQLDDKVFEKDEADSLLSRHFHTGISGLGLSELLLPRISAAAALRYVYDTQKRSLEHISNIRYYQSSQFMILDQAARRNLEITETMREKKKRGSLLWVLDHTETAMGARLLRRFLEQPLILKEEIENRLEAVDELCSHYIDREELGEYLSSVYDIERLLGKISSQSANPRDLIAFRESIRLLPNIRHVLSLFRSPLLRSVHDKMDELQDLFQLLVSSIMDDAPISVKEGGIIKAGYHDEVDKYRESRLNGKGWLSDLEAEEREKTGIRNLKIKYNRIFGYCFEVSKSFMDKVPDYFIRKQTLSNGERYTSDRLSELENIILGAEERLNSLEYELFSDIRDKISNEIGRVQNTSHAIALLDCMISLSRAATKYHYKRPILNQEGRIHIQDGRHPVIERLLPEGNFVSNDTFLDEKENMISIITGPNMAGKSTYMRQTALIVLMASIGSFVPAGKADICICDRIFTRVGASDDLSSGQSTFMVEMNEVASILRNATTRSLLILDEIGRGTSTFDGLSIAWAVVEYISSTVRAKTLFATHYHELTELEGKLPSVNNYCIAVRSQGRDIVFLRKIMPGGADRSYGIDVAGLAGVPRPVLERAREIAEELQQADIAGKARGISENKALLLPEEEPGGFDNGQGYGKKAEKAIEYLLSLDLDHISPRNAINSLFEMKDMLEG